MQSLLKFRLIIMRYYVTWRVHMFRTTWLLFIRRGSNSSTDFRDNQFFWFLLLFTKALRRRTRWRMDLRIMIVCGFEIFMWRLRCDRLVVVLDYYVLPRWVQFTLRGIALQIHQRWRWRILGLLVWFLKVQIVLFRVLI